MKNETITSEIPAPPEGFKFNGIRRVSCGELFFSGGAWDSWADKVGSQAKYPVAVRATKWVTPTDEDAKHRPKVQVRVAFAANGRTWLIGWSAFIWL